MHEVTLGGLALLRFDTAPAGLEAVVTTRHGGVSSGPYASLNLGDHVGDDPAAVRTNRDRLAAALGVEAITFADQTHTANVAFIDAALAGAGHAGRDEARAALPDVDALVTATAGVALAILVADCQPVVLFDPVRAVVGVAHAGRAGVVTGVVPATLDAMAERWGTDPTDVWVGIGPHIGATSYEVGPQEGHEVDHAAPGAGAVRAGVGDRVLVDLHAATRWQLLEAGVPADRIEHAGLDTLASTDVVFSDRAARPCGRFALVARLGTAPSAPVRRSHR